MLRSVQAKNPGSLDRCGVSLSLSRAIFARLHATLDVLDRRTRRRSMEQLDEAFGAVKQRSLGLPSILQTWATRFAGRAHLRIRRCLGGKVLLFPFSQQFMFILIGLDQLFLEGVLLLSLHVALIPFHSRSILMNQIGCQPIQQARLETRVPAF